MSKKSDRGLGSGVDKIFQPTGEQPGRSQQRQSRRGRGRPRKQNRSKETFSLDNDIQTKLEEAWLSIRQMADQDVRKRINKSLIVEVILKAALDEFEENGEESDLVDLILGNNGAVYD